MALMPMTRLEPPLNEPLLEGNVLARPWASFFIRLADQVADLQTRTASIEARLTAAGIP
jgi:hypothetical protein